MSLYQPTPGATHGSQAPVAAPIPNVRAGLFGTSLNDDLSGGNDMDDVLYEDQGPTMNSFGGGGRGRGGGGGGFGGGRGGRGGSDVRFQVRWCCYLRWWWWCCCRRCCREGGGVVVVDSPVDSPVVVVVVVVVIVVVW